MSVRFKLVLAAVALSGLLLPPLARSSVVMTGTRVIYPAGVREKTLQLINQDDHPNLVQVWADTGDAHSTPETADGPFIGTPQIFRMEPHAGQSVRLVFTGEAVPRDRESVFYLNFSQIPAIKLSEREANKLVLMFSSRLKIFYRPPQLPGLPEDLIAQMRFIRAADGAGPHVVAENPMAYHAVVRSASFDEGDAHCLLASAVMIAPMSKARWEIPRNCAAGASASQLKLVLVNDFGANVAGEVALR